MLFAVACRLIRGGGIKVKAEIAARKQIRRRQSGGAGGTRHALAPFAKSKSEKAEHHRQIITHSRSSVHPRKRLRDRQLHKIKKMATAQPTNQFNSPFSVENIINSNSRQGTVPQKSSGSPQSDHEHSIPTPDVSSSTSTSFGKRVFSTTAKFDLKS